MFSDVLNIKEASPENKDAFYGGRKEATTKFCLSVFLNLDMVPWNSAPGGFAYIWQTKWVGIIAIKTERTQSHFLSDVFLAVRQKYLKLK